MKFGKIFINTIKSWGKEYLCFEYKDAKGCSISSHTRFEIKDGYGEVVPRTNQGCYVVFSPASNYQLVLSFEQEVTFCRGNEVFFEDGTALSFYYTEEIDVGWFQND